MGDQRSNLFKQMTLIMLVCLSVTGCSVDKNLDSASAQESPFIDKKGISEITVNPDRNVYFGDLHVHTLHSYDAFTVARVRASPDDAYRFAKGESIKHTLGYDLRISGDPLDFYAVTDHAEFMGVPADMVKTTTVFSNHPLVKYARGAELDENRLVMRAIGHANALNKPISPGLDPDPIITSSWLENIKAAERNYDPGRFTTFIAYEYTSAPNYANLHRNVIFASSNVPEMPFGTSDSRNPEDLWDWMDDLRARGVESLAIPHNSNWSQGLMFRRTKYDGKAIDEEYVAKRMRNEPLVEITQIKGTSETHPALSPSDEWADFELWTKSTPTRGEDGKIFMAEGSTNGAYAREALRTGLEFQQIMGENPYKFGFIGSTDGHNGASPFEEKQYFGKLGRLDGTPQLRGSVPDASNKITSPLTSPEWGASGLVGVWAEQNTRESIYAALRRKETFATSGPRIKPRFFAGYDFTPEILSDQNAIHQAYQTGVHMGGEIQSDGEKVPKFFVWVTNDPQSGLLQRAQIVKGWMEGHESKESVYDVSCSDGSQPDPETFRCANVGATVDLADCSASSSEEATELKALWSDPHFDRSQSAFYYLRVLENPSCRWSTWDAVRAGIEPMSGAPKTIQERAWSSPIWYKPKPLTLVSHVSQKFPK